MDGSRKTFKLGETARGLISMGRQPILQPDLNQEYREFLARRRDLLDRADSLFWTLRKLIKNRDLRHSSHPVDAIFVLQSHRAHDEVAVLGELIDQEMLEIPLGCDVGKLLRLIEEVIHRQKAEWSEEV